MWFTTKVTLEIPNVVGNPSILIGSSVRLFVQTASLHIDKSILQSEFWARIDRSSVPYALSSSSARSSGSLALLHKKGSRVAKREARPLTSLIDPKDHLI